MSRTRTLSYNGHELFEMDFSNLRDLNLINEVMRDAAVFIRTKPKGSVICITTIEGMHFNNEIKAAFQAFIKENKPYIKSSAAVGLSGLQGIMFNGLMKVTGRNIKSFPTLAEAQKWLISKEAVMA